MKKDTKNRKLRQNEIKFYNPDKELVEWVQKRILLEQGYSVVTTFNAKDAEKQFQDANNHFDLIFSDVVLPDESGPSLISRLAKSNSDIKVLFASGYTDEKSEWDSIQKGGYST